VNPNFKLHPQSLIQLSVFAEAEEEAKSKAAATGKIKNAQAAAKVATAKVSTAKVRHKPLSIHGWDWEN
jgi:hypothetical protein